MFYLFSMILQKGVLMQNIIRIILLIQCFFVLTIFYGCNSSSKITVEDEPKILFVIYEAVPFEDGCAVIYVDNQGNLYYEYLYDNYTSMLEDDNYAYGEPVGYVSNEEVINNYNLFCEIPENISCEHIDVFGAAPTETIQLYCAVRYNEDGADVVPIWNYDSAVSMLNDDSAKEIILWMDSWEWELDKEGWDEKTEQWYPCSDWSNLGCVRLYLEE